MHAVFLLPRASPSAHLVKADIALVSEASVLLVINFHQQRAPLQPATLLHLTRHSQILMETVGYAKPMAFLVSVMTSASNRLVVPRRYM